MKRKGIILAGGSGTRLYPSTKSISKQLLPIYDKPLVYYPLSTLMMSGIRDILIITAPDQKQLFMNLLGDGSNLGINISYQVQEKPRGLADAFIVGESFIGNDDCCLILGDNIFFGAGLEDILIESSKNQPGAKVFAYQVSNPTSFGVVEFDKSYQAISIEEKPSNPKSNFAVTGLYFYDNSVVDKAKNLRPSSRGELEITDLNRIYLEERSLSVSILSRGFAWLDTGTPESMVEASSFIHALEKRQATKICCPEEIALDKGYLSTDDIRKQLHGKKGNYIDYIYQILELYEN
tara:strand:+ start:8644 stop:9522 length:879 start_codon:yes stop_codon:yes gene_type:complete